MLSNDLLFDQLTLLDKLTKEVKKDKMLYMEGRAAKLRRIDQVKDSILYLKEIINEDKKR